MGCFALLLLLILLLLPWLGGFFGSSTSAISASSLHHQLQHFDVPVGLKANCSRNLQQFTSSRAYKFPRGERAPLFLRSTKDNEDTIYMKQLPQLLKCPHYFSLEIEAMVDIVQNFQWHEIVFLHQDSQSSNQFASQLVDLFRDEEILISNKISISSSITYFNTLKILSNIANTQTRIIIADVTDVLVGSQLILAAKEAGLIRKGYAWLITSRMSRLLNSMNQHTLSIMEGALGVRPHSSLQSSTCENIPRGYSGKIMHSISFEVFNILGKAERVVANWRPNFRFSRDLGAIDDYDVVKHPNSVEHFRKIIWPGDSIMVPRSCDVPRAMRNGGPWRWIPR